MTERHALRAVGMSASALRYQPAPDRNEALRAQIVTLAQRHKRYGAEMICLKLRQAGQHINQKRVDRLYALERLQVRRRRRKKIQPGDRQPLIRPGSANEVWSEPPRKSRRLHNLRQWSHGKSIEVFPGVAGAGGSDGAGASIRA